VNVYGRLPDIKLSFQSLKSSCPSTDPAAGDAHREKTDMRTDRYVQPCTRSRNDEVATCEGLRVGAQHHTNETTDLRASGWEPNIMPIQLLI
jgi:hypothetical protein